MQKRAFEQTGLVPRSIIRTFDRFRRQILPGAETSVLQEFRISRYQVLVSVKCLFILLFTPLLASYFAKSVIFLPLAKYVWNTQQNEIFLNSYQEDRAFLEMQDFEEKIFFESLIRDNHSRNKLSETIVSGAVEDVLLEKTGVLLTNQKFFSSVSERNLDKAEEKTQKEMQKTEKRLLLINNRYEKPLDVENKLFPLLKRQSHQGPELRSDRGFESTKNQISKLNLTTKALSENTDDFSAKYTSESFIIPEKTNELDEAISQSLVPKISSSFLNEGKTQNKEKTNAQFLFPETVISETSFQKEIQQKTVELALHYNEQSIEAISNLFSSFITFFTVYLLFIGMKPQIIILKSFLAESLYNLSDTTKSFLLILLTDLLVGFHSPRGWEVVIEILLRNFGFPENEDFILLFVATFPVLLDTVFKYWIFRYLNQISPSTVATYHNMIE